MESKSIEGLVKYIQDMINKYGVNILRIRGSNGGDGVHYILAVGGGEWGHGEIYISFTNHGYLDRLDQFNPYKESIRVNVY